ncbi:MAG: ABC transporter ATP-binding protein [Rhodobacteraceae bacterium]|nr:MAG: ABC transporter ATP-binding protein [Paracoccaceae bacterium]
MLLPNSILSVSNLEVFYGRAQALHGVSFELNPGEMLSLIGSNGAGKSTLLKTIVGLEKASVGDIKWHGASLNGTPASQIIGKGIALVPEGRRLFRSLSVEENLVLGGQVKRKGPWDLAAVYNLFPILKERRHNPATALSGGQQQMVALGRALMSNPELLLLDELSLGLAPVIIKDIYALLPKIIGEGMSAILVEQDVTRALAVADRFICMQEGRISLAGNPKEFTQEQISLAYFGT